MNQKIVIIGLILGMLSLVLYDAYNYHTSTTKACEENGMKRVWVNSGYSCIDSSNTVYSLDSTKDLFPKYFLVKKT